MSHRVDAAIEELALFSNTVPPPPPSYDDTIRRAAAAVGHAHVVAAAARPGSGSNNDVPDLSPVSQAHNRPRLPENKRNPHLNQLPEEASIVKFQTIVRDDKEITVGRIKLPVPAPGQHAFILRRYDTDAISLTTMYKVAFPGATEEDEAREMTWVKSSFDTRNTNGERDNEHVRLAGQWVSRHLAVHLAPAYNMKELITCLARAIPDPTIEYRKSQRSQQAADEIRQRASAGPETTASVQPSTATAPAPSTATGPATEEPRAKRARPSGSADDADTQTFRLEAQTSVTGPAADAQAHMEAEIARAKQMVIDLRNELALQSAAGQALEDTGVALPDNTRGKKRGGSSTQTSASASTAATSSEDAAVEGEKGERVIRTNRKVERGPVAQGARQFAMGAFIFGLGVSAAAFLPQMAAQYF